MSTRREIPPAALRLDEAAAYTRIGRTKLYALIQEGELPSLRIGGSRLVLKKDLDALLERHRRTAPRDLDDLVRREAAAPAAE